MYWFYGFLLAMNRNPKVLKCYVWSLFWGEFFNFKCFCVVGEKLWKWTGDLKCRIRKGVLLEFQGFFQFEYVKDKDTIILVESSWVFRCMLETQIRITTL